MRVSTLRIGIALLAVLPGGGLGACRCQDESHEIQGTMPAVIERDGVPISTDLVGTLYVGNDNKTLPEYAPVVDFLTLSPSQTGAAAWTLTAPTGLEYLAVQLRGPRQAGEVVTVAGAFDGAGWGWEPSNSGPEARVGARTGSFVASEASGSIEVLGVAPMRLRLDVELRDGAGTTIRVRGDATFELVQRSIPCT
jgi:hypothetical protein